MKLDKLDDLNQGHISRGLKEATHMLVYQMDPIPTGPLSNLEKQTVFLRAIYEINEEKTHWILKNEIDEASWPKEMNVYDVMFNEIHCIQHCTKEEANKQYIRTLER
jgi:hypothetical protein